MRWINKLHDNYNQYPIALRTFLKRSLIFFVVFQCYFIGFESKSRFLNAPLTKYVAIHASGILNHFSSNNSFSYKPKVKYILQEGNLEKNFGSIINYRNKAILYIADACNGLELLALYIGFLLAVPEKINRKSLYLIMGSFFIYCMNVFRCIGLILLQINSSKHFDFAHHYLFKVIVYSSILALWHLYMQKITFRHAE